MRTTLWVRVSLVVLFAALAVPAAAEGNVFEWNLGTLAAGKVYPSTITAQNRCTKKQSFEITLEGLPWVKLVDPATFSVPPGGQHTVKVQLDTRGLASGAYAGTVVIRCLTCKPPSCNQDRDTLKVSLVVPAAAPPAEPALATPGEALSGLKEAPGAYTPETEAGRVAMGPCEVVRQQWREAVQRAKEGQPDCDEKRRKALEAKDAARKAQREFEEAQRVQQERRALADRARAEFEAEQAAHAAFLESILKGVDGIRTGAPFEANPERVWEAGYRYHGMTVPPGGLAYRDEVGLNNLIERLDQWADQLKLAEAKLKAKADALGEAEVAAGRADQDALAAAQKADDKQGEADKALREYLACLGQITESVSTANGLIEKIDECLEVVRLRDAEEVRRKKSEAEELSRLELQRKENERRLEEERRGQAPPPKPQTPPPAEPPRTQERPPSLPPPVPVLDEPQELTGGLRQVRIALYAEVKARAMEHYADQDCRYRCEKLLQSLLGEDFGDMVRDIGLDVMSASLSAFPAESTAQKAAVHTAKALMGFGKGKGAVEVLSERAASIIGSSLLPKVYGDWMGKQVNTFATGPTVKSILDAVESGELEVWEVDKVVEGHLGGGQMFSCPVHMRILYSQATGYVVACATCTCPNCPPKALIFRYRSDENGQPIGPVEVIE